MRTYTGLIDKPENDKQILIIGTNTQGRHGMGIALIGVRYWGAIYGLPKGLQGQCYGIVTKDLTKTKHPSISLEYIRSQVMELYEFARNNSEFEFIIPYSDKPSLNNHKPEDIANCFKSDNIPDNIIFEESFYNIIKST